VADDPQERRKYDRVTLLKPVPAKVGDARVFIMELGVSGMRIAHQAALPRVGQRFVVEFEWEARRLRFECEVVRNDLHKLAKSEKEKSTYHAGVHIVSGTGDAAVVLRKIVSEHVERALDEQRANARGIPAKAAHAFQTGKAREYVRCQLVNGEWRKSTTTRSDQPENGFTVSAEEDPAQVEMLCQAYAAGDESSRTMIRMMSEASLSTTDGIPTRKYSP
jgi:hypothetical protein